MTSESLVVALGKRIAVLDAEARPNSSGYAVGSTAERAAQEAEALRVFAASVRDGWSPGSAAAIAKADVREIIKRHNGSRSGDVNWQVSDNAYDLAVNTWRDRFEAVFDPETVTRIPRGEDG